MLQLKTKFVNLQGMVPLNHFRRKTKFNGPVVRMPHTSVEGSNKRHKCYIFLKKENKNRRGGRDKKTQKCKENNKCISKKQRKRKQNDPNYEEAYYNFKRQKKKETDQNKDQAKLMQEIDLKKNNKETLKDELVQNKDISEQVRDVIEQNVVRQNDGASYMQDVIQYVDECEKKNEMKRKRTELGQVEDGMEYDDNSKRAHFGMEHTDGSLHVEDEIYEAEQVENVRVCMDGLKKAVNGRRYKNETVNYELEFKDETQDKMKANKNGEIVKGNELDMDDRVGQIHVERARNEVQISGKVKEVVTVQKSKMNVRTVVKMDEMRQMNEMGHNLYNGHGGGPGYYWAVQNTPQCAICKLQHFGLCPWARAPCISCGTFGHFIDNCPLRLLQLFSLFFNYHYGS